MNQNSTSLPVETVPNGASVASVNTPDIGTSSESSLSQTQTVTVSKLPPETISCSVSSPPEQQFINLVETGLTAWIKAGELLVEMVKKDGEKAFKSILNSCPWMNEPMLWNFYRIGQKQLYPKTLIFASNQFVAREIASLPWELQAEVCERGLPLFNGEKSERKPVNELDRKDVDFGISEGKLRGMSEQMAMMQEDARDTTSRRSTIPKRQESQFYYPPEPIAPKPEPVLGISTGFYRVAFKFGTLTFTKIPKPIVDTQKIVLGKDMTKDLHAFIEVLRTPQT